MGLKKVSLPNQSVELVGFWAPEKEGQSLHGVLSKFITQVDPAFFAIDLLEDTEISARVEDKDGEFQKDEEDNFVTELITADKGDTIGLGRSNNLEGLEAYLGHEIKVTFLGKVKTKTKGRSVKKFDVEVSEKPVSAFKKFGPTAEQLGKMLEDTKKKTKDDSEDVPF